MLESRFLATVLLFLVSAGCRGTAGPDWSHPGSAPKQQTQALRYDPFPENEPGPRMTGVRPREYEKPPAETSRARWTLGNWGQ